jgi:galactokinase
VSAAPRARVAPAEVRAASGFRQRHAEPPAGVWASPGRVNLIGEHTDYNDGFVLPFALTRRTAVAAAPGPGGRWSVHSEQAGETVEFTAADLVPGGVPGWAGYVAGIVWVLREAGHRAPGATLCIASDVPLGAGLSSSAALECAVLTALADLGGLDLPVPDRPALAQRAENEYVRMPCGIMDQAAATLSRSGHALFLDCRSLEVDHIPFQPATAGLALLVIDTRAPHRHVTGEYADRRATCENAARRLGLAALRDLGLPDLEDALDRLPDEVTRRRVRHVVTENRRVLDTVGLLRAGRVGEIGPLLTASHASMRDDFEITVPETDTAVEAGLAAGAYGARMTGGGFGGCVLALVPADAAGAVERAVTRRYAARGWTPPGCFVADPAGGASKVEIADSLQTLSEL